MLLRIEAVEHGRRQERIAADSRGHTATVQKHA